jgi:hypothetical protein
MVGLAGVCSLPCWRTGLAVPCPLAIGMGLALVGVAALQFGTGFTPYSSARCAEPGGLFPGLPDRRPDGHDRLHPMIAATWRC